MLVLKVTMLEGRTPEKKAEVIRRLTESAARHLDEPAADIRIVIIEVTKEEWGAGGVTIKERESKS
jgi:4-oxalocrotonate tautomerase